MLELSSRLELPPEVALQNNGILAKSGAGKSNTSVVMVRETVDRALKDAKAS